MSNVKHTFNHVLVTIVRILRKDDNRFIIINKLSTPIAKNI